MISRACLAELVAPTGFFVSAILLRSHVVESPEVANQMTRGLVGPASWPQLLLTVIAFFSVLWAIERVVLFRKQAAPRLPTCDALATPINLHMGVAISFILLYGYLLAVIGFPAATLLYLVGWCRLGGIKSITQVSLIGLLGTTAFLYLFVKLAAMPLERGQGVMVDLSIALYRLLGIY